MQKSRVDSRRRLLGSTGEPWDDTSYLWFFENIGHGRCPIINISGGTEIVGSFLFPLPIQPLKPCTLGGPAPGIATEVVDETGRPVGAKTQSKFFVGNVPIRPPRPDAWGSPFLNVPVFEPPTIDPSPIDGIPHINLDVALQFLLGDRLR